MERYENSDLIIKLKVEENSKVPIRKKIQNIPQGFKILNKARKPLKIRHTTKLPLGELEKCLKFVKLC